jgi:hypothetical protein
MPTYQEKSRNVLESFLEKAFKQERNEMISMAKSWGVVQNNLDGLIIKLSEKESLTKNQLYQLGVYQDFLKQSKKQVSIFTEFSNTTIKEHQIIFSKLGIDMTQENISIMTVNFNRINYDAVGFMVGKTSKGSPISDLLAKSYPETVDKLTNTLVTSTALGRNPIETARLMKLDMNGNLKRALVVARTEQMNILRESSIYQMEKSGVCKGYIRIEQLDACDDCQGINGQEYDFDENVDTHPNCRGANIPNINNGG